MLSAPQNHQTVNNTRNSHIRSTYFISDECESSMFPSLLPRLTLPTPRFTPPPVVRSLVFVTPRYLPLTLGSILLTILFSEPQTDGIKTENITNSNATPPPPQSIRPVTNTESQIQAHTRKGLLPPTRAPCPPPPVLAFKIESLFISTYVPKCQIERRTNTALDRHRKIYPTKLNNTTTKNSRRPFSKV